MAPRRTRAPRFYFSLRSPYSWLAYQDLTRQYPALAGELEWVPFFEPDEVSGKMLTEAGGHFAYAPMSREKHLYILQDIRRLAAARGLTVAWPVDQDPQWEIPHLAYLVAAARGKGGAFIKRVYHVRWQEGRDICDRATMAEVARELALDPAELADAVDRPALREQGLAALLAVYRDGVFGVPFFVTGYEKFWGLDRLPAFVAAVVGRPVPHQPATPEAQQAGPVLMPAGAGTHGSDGGHEGGCG